MITELRLEKFGKFKEKTFPFASVTLFVGKNESGKTTIFDALLDVLTKPLRTTVQGKNLFARYGENRQVSIKYSEEPVKLSAADFLNLFAIRSGEITLEIEKDSQWMSQVKSSLFNGGIDPKTAAKRLEVILTAKGKGTLKNEENLINEELNTLREKQNIASERRKKHLGEEKSVEEKKIQISKLTEEIKKTKADIAELEKTVEQQNFIRETKRLLEFIKIFEKKRGLNEELEKYSRYTREKLEELKKRNQNVNRLKEEAEKARTIEEAAQRQKQKYTEEKLRSETEKKRADSRRNLAESLLSKLVPKENLIKKKTHRILRRPILFTAIAFLLAGGIGAIFAPSIFIKIALGGAGIVIFLILMLFRYENQSEEDTGELDAALKNARERWKDETDETLDTKYEAVLAALERACERARAAAEDYNRVEKQMSDFEIEINDLSKKRQESENNYQAAERDRRSFLDEGGAADEADYASKLQKKVNLDDENTELEKKILSEQKEQKTSSHEELESLLKSKYAALCDKITQEEISTQSFEAKKNELREKKERNEKLQCRENELIGEASGEEGKVQGRFEGLSEELVAYDKDIGEKKSRLAEIGTELRAAKIAKEIFESLAEDSDTMLEELSREIGASFSTLTDKVRKVNLKSFSEKKAADTAAVSDSGGEERAGEQLSAGTRDAFFLASRLVLARKSLAPAQKAIIVLDEPFLSLDRPRTERALGLLEEFRKKEDWQLILFTKDEELETQARAELGENLLVHKLDPLDKKPPIL